MPRSLVILDTETATLHAPPHRLEVGAVRPCVARVGGWSEVSNTWLLRQSAPATLASAGPLQPREPVQVGALERASRAEAKTRLWFGVHGEAPLRPEVFPEFLYRWSKRDDLEGERRRSGSLETYRLDRERRVELRA